jgi:membrane protein implicated in regulation of membrane protease activity
LCELATGSGTPREEGAIWRMTCSGRRNPGEGARVVRVARERDDIK